MQEQNSSRTRLMLPVHFADGAFKTFALHPKSSVHDLLGAFIAKSSHFQQAQLTSTSTTTLTTPTTTSAENMGTIMSQSSSTLSLDAPDQEPAMTSADANSAYKGWKLVIERFPISKHVLFGSDSRRVMTLSHHVGIGEWGRLYVHECQPSERVLDLLDRFRIATKPHSSQQTLLLQSTSAQPAQPAQPAQGSSPFRFKLINEAFGIKLKFNQNVLDVPTGFGCVFYVTPGMSPDDVLKMVEGTFLLGSRGQLTSGSHGNASGAGSSVGVDGVNGGLDGGLRYVLLECKVHSSTTGSSLSSSSTSSSSDGPVEFQKCTKNPLQLRFEAQPLLANSRTLRDYYFEVQVVTEGWRARMNYQALKLKNRVASVGQLHAGAAASTLALTAVSSGHGPTVGHHAVVVGPQKARSMDSFLVQQDQDRLGKLRALSDREFDALFEQLLDDLNLRQEHVRREMRSYAKDRKMLLLVQNMRQVERQQQTLSSGQAVGSPTKDRSGGVLSPQKMRSSHHVLLSSPTSTNIDVVTATGTLSSDHHVVVEKQSSTVSGLLGLWKRDSSSGDKSPSYYIEKLNAKNPAAKSTLKHLVSLRVTLTTAKISWIRQFVEHGAGLVALANVLDRVTRKAASGQMLSDTEEDSRAECMKCLRTLLNTEPGFSTVLSSQSIVSKIALCLHTTNDKLRSMVAEVLAALCILSHDLGHQRVLNAMADLKNEIGERERFEYLVESIIGTDPLSMSFGGLTLPHSPSSTLSFSDERNPLVAYDYKTTAMSLVNALIGVPERMEKRIELRDEFFRRGLTVEALMELRRNAPASLITQLDLYDEEMAEDLK